MGLMGTSAFRKRSLAPAPAAPGAPSYSVGPTGQMQAHPAPQPAPQLPSAGKWAPGAPSGGSASGSIWDAAQGRGGMAQSKGNINVTPAYANNMSDPGGVVAGAPAGNAVAAAGGQQMPAFDPNDPNNAALIGYRNG